MYVYLKTLRPPRGFIQRDRPERTVGPRNDGLFYIRIAGTTSWKNANRRTALTCKAHPPTTNIARLPRQAQTQLV